MSRNDAGENTRVVRAVGQIGGLTLLSRISGLGRDMVIGSVFGAGLAADAFFVAFRIPNLLRRLVGEGATDAAFVPVLTRYLPRRSRAASRTLRAFFGTGLGLLLVLTGLGIGFADPITRLFAPGFMSDKLLLTIDLTRIMFVYLFWVGAAALVMGVLHALRHFTAPAFAPVLFNAAVIVSVFGLSAHTAEPVLSLAYGVVLGGVCQLLWQLPALVRHGVSLRLSWQPRHPALRRMGRLLLPLVFGTGIFQLNQIISTLLASLLADGSVARLWYASRLFEFPVGIFVVALSTAVLPSLATQAQQKDWASMQDSLGFALRLVNVVTLPAAVGLAVLATPITTVLFFRGAFSAQDVAVTAAVLQALALGLWAVAATRQVTACLYALGDTRTPVWGGVVALMSENRGRPRPHGPYQPPRGGELAGAGCRRRERHGLDAALGSGRPCCRNLARGHGQSGLPGRSPVTTFFSLSVATVGRLSAVERHRLGRDVGRAGVVCGAD